MSDLATATPVDFGSVDAAPLWDDSQTVWHPPDTTTRSVAARHGATGYLEWMLANPSIKAAPIPVPLDDLTPKEQVAADLFFELVGKKVTYGDTRPVAMPSSLLARLSGVSPRTARRALSVLLSDGRITVDETLPSGKRDPMRLFGVPGWVGVDIEERRLAGLPLPVPLSDALGVLRHVRLPAGAARSLVSTALRRVEADRKMHPHLVTLCVLLAERALLGLSLADAKDALAEFERVVPRVGRRPKPEEVDAALSWAVHRQETPRFGDQLSEVVGKRALVLLAAAEVSRTLGRRPVLSDVLAA